MQSWSVLPLSGLFSLTLPDSGVPEALYCSLIGGLVNDLSFESDRHKL